MILIPSLVRCRRLGSELIFDDLVLPWGQVPKLANRGKAAIIWFPSALLGQSAGAKSSQGRGGTNSSQVESGGGK